MLLTDNGIRWWIVDGIDRLRKQCLFGMAYTVCSICHSTVNLCLELVVINIFWLQKCIQAKLYFFSILCNHLWCILNNCTLSAFLPKDDNIYKYQQIPWFRLSLQFTMRVKKLWIMTAEHNTVLYCTYCTVLSYSQKSGLYLS